MSETQPPQTEDMWTPYKELQRMIEFHLTRETEVPDSEIMMILRKYKQNFFNLLQNTPKNAKAREELKKGLTEGISVRGIGHQVLSKELYQETIIISDMYDLNEYMALDLLCTAQIQLPHYPGLTRGLVAVLLYYDGRKALVSSLRLLVQARKGVLWKLDINDNIVRCVTEFTDQLMSNGVFNRVLDLLKSLDVSKEVELLQKNRALGNPKHHRQVLDLFQDIRQELADVVFMYAAQSGLSRMPATSLISHLRSTKLEEDAAGSVDGITLTLQMALLYALDVSILHTRDDGEDVVQSLPMLSEAGLVEALLSELSPARGKWESEGLHAMSMLAMGLCLASLRLIPQSQAVQLAMEQEDAFTDTAINMKVFEFMSNVFLRGGGVHRERFYLHRMHNLVTDFIVLMQSKVKDLRIRADEIARTLQAYSQEGLEAPANLPRHFENLLYCIARLYGRDPLRLGLSRSYWYSPEAGTPQQSFQHRSSPRDVSLFKFVRLAGDMVPPSLFVPYLTMLASLAAGTQSARHCFNMLKQSGPGQAAGSLSWDHFFSSFSRYLSNLRQEAPPTTDTVYRHRNYPRGITPQEVQGLHAVLLVIRTVAEHDDFSRVALCEHPAWAPLSIFLGLISCPIPIPLKASLLSTLAALSKSPETAAQMWNNLEASQILVTVPSTSSYQPRGIQTELEEIESRLEEYPMTRALLELLDVLTDSGIPRTLGAGPRKPGFDPYLTFVVNSVFLKFHTRAYKSPEEKWQVAKACLHLLDKLLAQYSPAATDFPAAGHASEFNSPPGFHLMVQLNTKSQFLDLVLMILDEGCSLLDSYTNFAGKACLEDCTLSCLNILLRTLTLQQTFFTLLSGSSSTILLTSLAKLLLSINPRTSKPDYVWKICKYVGFQSVIPAHALLATKILLHVTRQPPIHSQMMTILLSFTEIENELRAGFVSALDAEEDPQDKAAVETVVATKEAIIQLLKQCLGHASPNLTHYLCGFQLKRDISKTIFQFPGVLGFPRTCFHSLFGIMNSAVEGPKAASSPLLEEAYSMLYVLAANPKTSAPVLKFVRQNHEFYTQHIQAISKTPNLTTSEMNQISWFLKTLAIEQKMCAGTNQIYHLQHLMQLLVGYPKVVEKQSDEEPFDEFMAHSSSSLAAGDAPNLLSLLIKNFDFNSRTVASPQWDYFDAHTMDKLIMECESAGQGPRLIDVKKLHQTLMDELSTLQGTSAASQRQLIMQEIQKVLTYALKVNEAKQHAAATIRFVDAWRQLTQVIFVTLPAEVLNTEEQQMLLLDVLETLLNKMLHSQPLPEVAIYCSSTVLLLLEALRKSHLSALQRRKVLSNEDFEMFIAKNIIYKNTSSLKFILHGVLEWILISGVSCQKLRVNLYGSLLIFLQLISVGCDEKKTLNHSTFYVSRLDDGGTDGRDTRDDYMIISADVLSSFGDKLIEVLCHDCIGGHDICRMLAMSSFNMLIVLSMQPKWINFLASKGYLKHLIDSLLSSDQDLKDILETVPDSLRPIYLYETKMSLMIRMANTRAGAELLLEYRLLACLASMKVFDDHPKIERQNCTVLEDFIPPVENRYLQILFPALDLCGAILTSLGTENRWAVTQVMHFLLSHLEVVEMVLQHANPSLPANFLKELSMITGLVARTANNDLCLLLENEDSSPNDKAYLHRLQKLMLALLPRFVLADGVVKELVSGNIDEQQEPKPDRLIYSLQIACNLVLYARNLIANHGVEHGSTTVVFQPSLNDSLAANWSGRFQYSHYSEQAPSIGVVVQQLIQCIQYYHKEKVTLDFLTRKVSMVSTMNSIDLKEFVPAPTRSFNIFTIREGAHKKLSERLQYKQCEMNLSAFLTENCLYLIWAHLDYYMLKAIPKTKNFSLTSGDDSMNSTLIPPTEITWKVTADDVSNLKQGLVSIFNDILSRQLVETTQDRPELDKGFVEALLRRIKRLIQFVPVK